ncbi:hypothetical protein ONZ45_g13459 [Pleurotus djamor]|nr:hypothetical protein ONZ45_g13459 [Pleurotus djamor]
MDTLCCEPGAALKHIEVFAQQREEIQHLKRSLGALRAAYTKQRQKKQKLVDWLLDLEETARMPWPSDKDCDEGTLPRESQNSEAAQYVDIPSAPSWKTIFSHLEVLEPFVLGLAARDRASRKKRREDDKNRDFEQLLVQREIEWTFEREKIDHQRFIAQAALENAEKQRVLVERQLFTLKEEHAQLTKKYEEALQKDPALPSTVPADNSSMGSSPRNPIHVDMDSPKVTKLGTQLEGVREAFREQRDQATPRSPDAAGRKRGRVDSLVGREDSPPKRHRTHDRPSATP